MLGALSYEWAPISVATLVFAAITSISPPSSAFERQWHLGAGGGVVVPGRAYRIGPAAALHAAYGISDVFDARLELRSSFHDRKTKGIDRDGLFQSTLALAYKLDVIEWVPYLGVRAGYYRFWSSPAKSFSRQGGMIGTLLGVDYAFSRSAAVGAELAYDTLLPEGTATSVTLHAEYRFGW